MTYSLAVVRLMLYHLIEVIVRADSQQKLVVLIVQTKIKVDLNSQGTAIVPYV